MNETTLRGFQKAAEMVTTSGQWEVRVPTRFAPKGYVVKAFGLTEERAKDWAKFYKDGYAVAA